MKRLLAIAATVAVLILAGCSIFGPTVVDHSDTVLHYSDKMVYDFDQVGASGFYFKTDGTGEAVSVNDNAELIDFWYNDRDYTIGAYIVSPDGDTTVYNYPADKDPKTTYFYKIEATDPEEEDTAPTTKDELSAQVEPDAWYFLLLEDDRYVILHVTQFEAPYDVMEFEYWIQQDETRYFGEEQD